MNEISTELACTCITTLSLIIIIWATPIFTILRYKLPTQRLEFIWWLYTIYLKYAVITTVIIMVVGTVIITLIGW